MEFLFHDLESEDITPAHIYEEKNKTAFTGKLFLQSSILFGKKMASCPYLSEDRKRSLERNTMLCATIKLCGGADC